MTHILSFCIIRPITKTRKHFVLSLPSNESALGDAEDTKLSESQTGAFFIMSSIKSAETLDNLRKFNVGPTISGLKQSADQKVKLEQRYLSPELSPAIIHLLQAHLDRWKTNWQVRVVDVREDRQNILSDQSSALPETAVANKSQKIKPHKPYTEVLAHKPNRNFTDRMGYPQPVVTTTQDIEGQLKLTDLGFKEQDQKAFYQFCDVIWKVLLEKYEEVMSLVQTQAGEKPLVNPIHEQDLSFITDAINDKLTGNRVYLAFSKLNQQRDGSNKRPWDHSIKVFRNLLRQNLFGQINLEKLDFSLQEIKNENISPLVFLTMFMTLVHDIGNLYFIDNDKFQFHALFSSWVVKNYLVYKGVDQEVIELVAGVIDKHHTAELAGSGRLDQLKVEKDYEKQSSAWLVAISLLMLADVSTTKKLAWEIENLVALIQAAIDLKNDDSKLLLAQAIINRIQQLIILAQVEENAEQIEQVRSATGILEQFRSLLTKLQTLCQITSGKTSSGLDSQTEEKREGIPEQLVLLQANIARFLATIFPYSGPLTEAGGA